MVQTLLLGQAVQEEIQFSMCWKLVENLCNRYNIMIVSQNSSHNMWCSTRSILVCQRVHQSSFSKSNERLWLYIPFILKHDENRIAVNRQLFVILIHLLILLYFEHYMYAIIFLCIYLTRNAIFWLCWESDKWSMTT